MKLGIKFEFMVPVEYYCVTSRIDCSKFEPVMCNPTGSRKQGATLRFLDVQSSRLEMKYLSAIRVVEQKGRGGGKFK